MKKNKINYLLLMIMALSAIPAAAHDFEVDGIYYNINGNEVTVTYKGNYEHQYSNYYSGDLFIPSSVTWNGKTYRVTAIGRYAIQEHKDLKSITIPYSITHIDELAIGSNIKLSSLIVDIDNQFYDSRENCNAIIETASNTLVTGCQTTVIPQSISSIGNWAFYYCTGFTSFSIPNSITSIGRGAFNGCQNLRRIDIPSSVTYIGPLAFSICRNLDNIEIPNSVTFIGSEAFNQCIFTSFIIPNSLHALEAYTFRQCRNLTNIVIPNTITSVGDKAFVDCTNLTSIEIPNSITTFGYSVFEKCDNISTLMISGEGEWQGGSIDCSTSALYIDSRITSLQGIEMNPNSDVYTYANTPPVCDSYSFSNFSGTLHVPASSLASYFVAPYWCNFANIIGDAVEPSVTISCDSMELNLGEQFVLTSSVVPLNESMSNITWTSTNYSVATVNNGIVTAVGSGECDIIVQFLYKRAICHVFVHDTSVSIELDLQNAMLLPNHIITLTPSASPVMPELAVSSSEPNVAAARVMNGKVQVVGIKEGTTTITVGSTDGTAIPATCLVTVYTELGDLNSDGFINISDVTALISFILTNEESLVTIKNADINHDGKINVSDVTMLISTILDN